MDITELTKESKLQQNQWPLPFCVTLGLFKEPRLQGQGAGGPGSWGSCLGNTFQQKTQHGQRRDGTSHLLKHSTFGEETPKCGTYNNYKCWIQKSIRAHKIAHVSIPFSQVPTLVSPVATPKLLSFKQSLRPLLFTSLSHFLRSQQVSYIPPQVYVGHHTWPHSILCPLPLET